MRRIIIGAAALAAIVSFASGRAEAQSHPHVWDTGCVMFEDDSFVCGHVLYWDSDQPNIDRSRPFVTGCVPDGLCRDEDEYPPQFRGWPADPERLADR